MAREHESARYQQAAHLALDQLDWCINYLRRIHMTTIANQLARNRSAIRRRLEERRGNANGDTYRPRQRGSDQSED
jgi:hypothetical protein